MVRKHASALAVFIVFLMVLPLAAQAPSQSELSAIHQIKDEGFNDSKIMEIMTYLTDVYGPRLTNSPDIKEADRKSTRLNSSHGYISYAVFCLKKKKKAHIYI